MIPDILPVVHHVVVCEHDALREPGGSRRVLHIGHIVGPYRRRPAAHLLGRGLPGQRGGLLPGKASRLPVPHSDDVPQKRQPLAVEGLPRLGRLQLRAQLGNDLRVVAVPIAVDHHQRMGIGLPQQILRLMDLVGGVHRHQHRPDLRSGPEGNEPGRNVGGPDRHLVAALDPQGDQRPRKLVHIVPELGIGPGVVQRGILEGVLIRELLYHPVQHLGEGAVDDDVLLPHILARPGGVIVQAALPSLPLKAGHVDGVVGQDHLRVIQPRHPGGVPEQGHEPVIVDASQRVHQLPQGQRPLAYQLRASQLRAVGEPHVAHISPQVGDGLFRRFLLHQAGAVRVPAGRQMVAGEIVQHIHQFFRVSHRAAALQQQGNVIFLRQRDQRRELLDDRLPVIADGVERHIGDQQICRRLHGGVDLVLRLRGRQVGSRPHAGDGQVLRRQLPPGRRGQLRIRGAVSHGQEGVLHAVDLQAAELGAGSGLTGCGPVQFGPVFHGKR